MENKIAIIGIIVKDNKKSEYINSVLHDYSQYIIGRMGLPYRTKGMFVISVAVDAPYEKAEELAAKIKELDGVSADILYA